MLRGLALASRASCSAFTCPPLCRSIFTNKDQPSKQSYAPPKFQKQIYFPNFSIFPVHVPKVPRYRSLRGPYRFDTYLVAMLNYLARCAPRALRLKLFNFDALSTKRSLKSETT